MKLILMTICFLMAVILFFKYQSNKKWEDLIENKQKSFKNNPHLKNKQSKIYRDVTLGLCLAVCCFSFIPNDMFGLNSNMTTRVNESLYDEELDFESLWEKTEKPNDYTQNYKIKGVANILLMSEPIEEFDLVYQNQKVHVEIYQEQYEMFAKALDVAYGIMKVE